MFSKSKRVTKNTDPLAVSGNHLYPDSADARNNLADAYLKNGQKDLARQYAEKALAMIDSHKAPLSSWSDTEQRRAEIRNGVQETLKELAAAH